jgi:valyl-tRNA synthetase
MAKPRLQDPALKPTVQRVLAHALDTLLRLLHPIMPFITEEMWRNLNRAAPLRGLTDPQPASEWLIVAAWPEADMARQDAETEARFATFQAALAALREIRNRQNIATRLPLEFCIQCDYATAELLRPMSVYFQSMANAAATGFGPGVTPPATHGKAALSNMQVYVDLKDFIDVHAEIAKNEQLEQKLLGIIKGKEGKLASESFVQRAPANVVQGERDALAQAQEQLGSIRSALAGLRGA